MATHVLRLVQDALGSSPAWVPSPPGSSGIRRPLRLTTCGLDRSACARPISTDSGSLTLAVVIDAVLVATS